MVQIFLNNGRTRFYTKSAGMQNVFLANTSPHQLCWGDWEMGTAISCTKSSQVAGYPCGT